MQRKPSRLQEASHLTRQTAERLVGGNCSLVTCCQGNKLESESGVLMSCLPYSPRRTEKSREGVDLLQGLLGGGGGLFILKAPCLNLWPRWLDCPGHVIFVTSLCFPFMFQCIMKYQKGGKHKS